MDSTSDDLINQLKFYLNQNEKNISQTKNSFELLQNHLGELNSTVKEFKEFLDTKCSWIFTGNEFETRLLQINRKTKQIENCLEQFDPAVIIEQILDQISPSSAKSVESENSSHIYFRLIQTIEASLKQKTRLLENYNDRRNILMKSIEKLLLQHRHQQETFERLKLDRLQFHFHSEQLAEFDKLAEQFRELRHENENLKIRAKENAKNLYELLNRSIV